MASLRLFCVLVTVLLSGNVPGHSAARLKRTTSDNLLALPFLQDLQTWALPRSAQTSQNHAGDLNIIMEQISKVIPPNTLGSAGQSLNINNILQLAETGQEIGKDRIELQVSEGDENNPAISVVVETISAEDLLATEEGRQQLSQLSSRLEQVMNSVGVEVMQSADQVGKVVDELQNLSAESMLDGLFNMLAGDDYDHALWGIMESQSLEAMNQLTQALDQLPTMKSLLGKLYGFVEYFHLSDTDTIKNMQQLLMKAAMSFQAKNGEMGQGATLSDVNKMLQTALNSLNSNLELLEFMAEEVQQTAHNPSFLMAVNDTDCLVKSLRGELSTDRALGCLEHLMQVMAMVNQSEPIIITFIHSLTHLVEDPLVLQSLTELMKMPSWEKALTMIQTMVRDLKGLNAMVLASTMQTLHDMLQSLWDNQELLETLSDLVQNPESSHVYENALEFLKNSTRDDPATQQILRVINDSISLMWQEASAQTVLNTVQEIVTVLENDPDITQPLSESQQALVDLLNKFMVAAQNAINIEERTTLTPTPAITTNQKPETTTPNDALTTTDTPTTKLQTTRRTTMTTATTKSTERSSPELSTISIRTTPPATRPGTTETSRSSEVLTTSPRTTTESSNTVDDSGSATVSFSTLLMITAVLLAAL